jgi:O-antigen/teichoic acid export membrane protein
MCHGDRYFNPENDLKQESTSLNLSLLGKNTLIYAAGNIILRLSSFLLIPLYTYTLPVAEFGLLAGVLVLVQIMISLMGIKTRESVIRFFYEAERNHRVGTLFGSSLVINLLGGLFVSLVAFFCLSGLFSRMLKTSEMDDLILLACGVALGQSLSMNFSAYYRARNDSRRFVQVSLLSFVLVFLLTFAFLIVFNLGILGALAAQVIGYFCVAIFVCFEIFSREVFGFSWDQVVELLRYGSPLVLGDLGDHAITSFPIFLLGYLSSLEAVAIYSLGFRITQVVGTAIILPFQMAFEPFVFANLHQPQLRRTMSALLTYLLFLCIIFCFGVAIFAKDIVQLMAPERYLEAYLVVLFILPATAFRGTYYVGEAMLHIRKKTQISGGVLLVVGICSLPLNFLLISWMGVYGAVLAFNLAVIFLGISTLVLGMKVFPIPLEIRRLAVLALLLALLIASVFVVDGFVGYAYYAALIAFAFSCFLGLHAANFFNGREISAAKGVWQRLRTDLV